MNVQQIAVDKLEPNPFQYRSHFPTEKMRELEESVAAHGVLQPILARPIEGKKYKGVAFQIVAGERRWRAAQSAHLKTVPAVVRAMTDIEALSIALIENTQREDPDDWATAQGIRSLMELHAKAGAPLTEPAVARLLGKSPGYVRNHLGLFKLRPALQEVAQRISGIRSSLFEVQKVADVETERELLAAIEGGAAFSQVKASVEEHLQNVKWRKESQTPDAASGARGAENERDGGGNVSRGKPVQGNTAREALEAVEESVREIEWKADTIESWMGKLTERQRAKLVPRFKRLGQRLGELGE